MKLINIRYFTILLSKDFTPEDQLGKWVSAWV